MRRDAEEEQRRRRKCCDANGLSFLSLHTVRRGFNIGAGGSDGGGGAVR
jgi:hypothetical protein